MIRLVLKPVPAWPKLAWVATFAEGADTIDVHHGPMVEARADWCVEAVWAGDFASGDFDRTDLVFGTGIRVREDRAIFVSAGTGVDRLWHCKRDGTWHVSNSLPALLACAGQSLRNDYPHYASDMATIEDKGLKRYVRCVPTDCGEVNLLYFNNLCYDGQCLREAEKPDPSPHFKTYQEYYDFLMSSAESIGVNLSSPQRAHRIVPLVGISSGYDSPATAVVARRAGCREAATIVNATSLWRGSDSGEEIAELLQLHCRKYRHDGKAYPREESVWAARGRSAGCSLTLFEYPEPLCLLFSGSCGDKLWVGAPRDFSELEGDADSLLCEFRLIQGLFHCLVPWWGIRRAREINAISLAPEMEHWTLHTCYDRPIARRLVEEAGIARGMFGKWKKNTSSSMDFPWPRSPESRERFEKYLKDLGLYVPSSFKIRCLTTLAHVEGLIAMNLTQKLGFDLRLRQRLQLTAQSLLFQWGNFELKQVYENGLIAAGAQVGRVSQRKSLPGN